MAWTCDNCEADNLDSAETCAVCAWVRPAIQRQAPTSRNSMGGARRSSAPTRTVLAAGASVIALLLTTVLIVTRSTGGRAGIEGDTQPPTTTASVSSGSLTSIATNQVSGIPSPTPSSTSSPTPTVVPKSTQVTPALAVTLGLPYSPRTPTTGGNLTINVTSVGGPVRGAYFDVFKTKEDARGQPVPGDGVTGGGTDNSGVVTMALPAGTYIVTSNLKGVNWGNLQERPGVSGIVVEGGKSTVLNVQFGRIKVVFTTVDGVLRGQYVDVYAQATDAKGNAVTGAAVTGDGTDNTGIVGFDLVPGTYVLVSNVRGANWGDLAEKKGKANVTVQPGAETVITVSMGRLVVTTSNYVDVYLQDIASSGAPVRGQGVTGDGPGNLGRVQFDLTPGTYAITTSGTTTFNVVVQAGKVTEISR